MKMYLKIEDGVIKDIKFKTFGCGAAIATSSIATEMIKGKPVEDALKLTNEAVIERWTGFRRSRFTVRSLRSRRSGRALRLLYPSGHRPLPIVGPIGDVACAE
jgi:nitrogen fixation NifU-like protein